MGLAEDIMAQVDVGRKSTEVPTDLLLAGSVKEAMAIWSTKASRDMAEFLNQKKNRSTGLGQDITALPVEQKEDYLELIIDAPESPYWEFVDKGVNGILSGAYGSPFSFKTLGVAPNHQRAIAKWMGEVRMQPRENQTWEQAAYVIARSVKEKGIEPTKFVENVLTESYIGELEKAILDITGETVKIKLKNGNNRT